MSDAAGRMRMAADELSDARTSLRQGDLDTDADVPEDVRPPEEIVEEIDGSIQDLMESLRTLALNVEVFEGRDERD